MKKTILWAVFLLLLFLMGCSHDGEEKSNNSFFSTVKNYSDSYGYIYYESPDVVDYMEVGQDGTVYLLTYDEESGSDYFLRIDGSKEYKVKLDDFYKFLYFDENSRILYAYNSSKKCLETRNNYFELVNVVIEDFSPFEIKEMAVHGDKLYMLTVSDNPFEHEEYFLESDEEYIDYGEKLYEIQIDNGQMSDLGLNGIVTMCDSDEVYLYLYVHRDNNYFLEVYDTEKKEVVHSKQLNEPGYVFSMGIIDNKLYYISSRSSGICSYDIQTENVTSEIGDVLVLGQSDFDVRGKYLIYVDRNKREIHSFDTETGIISSKENVKERRSSESDVVIGLASLYDLPIEKSKLSALTGMSIGTYTAPVMADSGFNEQMMTKLMAGDSDIDIYILYISYPYTRKLMQDGVCYPLGDSEIIKTENDKMFDGIGDFFRTQSGIIWGIPLRTYPYVMVTSSTKMKEEGLDGDIFRDYFHFMSALKTINNRDGIYINGLEYGIDLFRNYETNYTYSDFGKQEFKDYFESLWGGWVMYEEYGKANNPYMGKEEGYKFSPETSLMSMMTENTVLSDFNNMDGIEVYPLPLISEAYKQSINVPLVAIVNPNGKNRDNAIKVMEQLMIYMRESGKLGAVYKNLEDYPESINTETQIFRSIYDINSNAIVTDHGILNEILNNEIREFQKGNIDLDTAIKSMQRKEDAYRNE